MKKYDSSFVGDNVKYYDFFFLPDEKVDLETQYIKSIWDNNGCCYTKLLDIGCGTGKHAFWFSKMFDHVYGVDASENMIEYANANHKRENIIFKQGDVARHALLDLEGKFYTAISLAHVIGYMIDDDMLKGYMQFVSNNIERNGLFFFNFYNLIAVYRNHLSPRCIEKESKEKKLTRISNASIAESGNILNLDYFYVIDDNGVFHSYEIHEKMRCFTKMEIRLLLQHFGFDVIEFYNYGTQDKLSCDAWNAGCLAKKR